MVLIVIWTMAIEHCNITNSHLLMSFAAAIYLWKHSGVDSLFSIMETFNHIDVVSTEHCFVESAFLKANI